jgi:hypothetical protein
MVAGFLYAFRRLTALGGQPHTRSEGSQNGRTNRHCSPSVFAGPIRDLQPWSIDAPCRVSGRAMRALCAAQPTSPPLANRRQPPGFVRFHNNASPSAMGIHQRKPQSLAAAHGFSEDMEACATKFIAKRADVCIRVATVMPGSTCR